MNQEELDKKLKKQEILVKDEKVWSYTYEDHKKQLYRTLANNHILPRWIELSKEIEDLKERLKENTNTAEAAELIRTINKKVLEHNLLCPTSAQKMRVKMDF